MHNYFGSNKRKRELKTKSKKMTKSVNGKRGEQDFRNLELDKDGKKKPHFATSLLPLLEQRTLR